MRRLILVIIASVFIIIISVPSWLVMTESGLLTTMTLVQRFVPELTIQKVSGTLYDGAVFEQINYQSDDSHHINIGQLLVSWQAEKLFSGRFVIDRLHVGDVIVFQQQVATTSVPDNTVSNAHVVLPTVVWPFPTYFHDIRVKSISYVDHISNKTEVLTDLEMEGKLLDSQVELIDLTVENVLGTILHIDGTVDLTEQYQIALNYDWLSISSAPKPIRAEGIIKGNLAKLDIKQSLLQPVKSQQSITLNNILFDLNWQFDAQLTEAFLRDFSAEQRGVMRNLVIMSQGDLHTATIQIETQFSQDGLPELRIKSQAKSKGFDNWHVETEVATTDNVKLAMSGEIQHLLSEPYVMLTGHMADITLSETFSTHAIYIKESNFSLEGVVEQWSVSSDSNVMVNSVPMSVTLLGKANGQGFQQLNMRGVMPKGQVAFKGQALWQDNLVVTGAVSFENIDPSLIISQWPGDLSGGWHLSASTTAGEADITIQDLKIDGRLRQRPVQLAAELSYINSQLTIPRFRLDSDQSTVLVNGYMKEAISFSWQISSPELDDLYPDLAGQLDATGKVTGTRNAPIISADVTGQNMSYANVVTIEELAGHFDVDMDQQGSINAQAAMTNVSMDNFKKGNIKLAVTGRKNAHQIAIDFTSKELAISSVANGDLTDKNWQGQLTKLQLSHDDAGQWALTEQGKITVAKNAGSLTQHCLSSQTGLVCLKVAYDDSGRWTSKGSIAAIPMSLLDKVTDSLPSLQGQIDGEFELAGNRQYQITGNGYFSVQEGNISLAENNVIENETIHLKTAKIEYQLSAKSSVVTMQLTPDLQGVSALTGQVTLPATDVIINTPEKAELSGYVKAAIDDLTVFGSLSPEYENLYGRLNVDMNLAGTVSKPVSTGNIVLDQAGVDLTSLGVTLSNVEAAVNGDLASGLQLKYQATSGEGTLSGEGQILFADEGWKMTLSLQGRELVMLNLAEAYVIASPDLMLSMDRFSTNIDGRIVVPTAELAPLKFNMPVTASKDVVVINREAEKKSSGLPTKLNINLVLGDKVQVKGFGFDGRVTGELLVTGSTNKILLGTGDLIIKDGSYIAYGQKLAIDDGKIHFSGGALDNPDLDIRAVRKGGDFLVGLQLLGAADNPQISLFSSPVMNDNDVLAYLLLGRPINDASASDAAMLATAATGLGIKGGNMLGEQIANTFGLETLGINGNGGDGTALQIGKYLSPKLYLDYGIGIFEPINTVGLRYELSKMWALKAKSGVETGVDLLFMYKR